MRHVNKAFYLGSLVLFMLAVGCRPAATPLPVNSPTPEVASPQSVPTIVSPLAPTGTPISTETPVTATTGVHLAAKVGPTCPGPQRPGQVCEGPYQGEFVITANGAEVTTVTTDAEGLAMVELAPGNYTVALKSEARLPQSAPVDFTVAVGQITEVNIEIDSGMR